MSPAALAEHHSQGQPDSLNASLKHQIFGAQCEQLSGPAITLLFTQRVALVGEYRAGIPNLAASIIR